MRIGFPLYIISISLLICACGDMGGDGRPTELLSADQKMRNELEGTWESCKVQTSGSAKIITEIRGENIRLDAQTYTSEDCSGNYESYRMARFVHDEFFADDDRHRAVAKLKLTRYYPQDQEFEEGLLRIEDRVLAVSKIQVVFSEGYETLDVTFEKVETVSMSDLRKIAKGSLTLSAAAVETTDDFRLKLVPGRRDVGQIAGLRDGSFGIEDLLAYDTQDEAILWNLEIVSKATNENCVRNYFEGSKLPEPPPSEDFLTGFFKRSRPHKELVSEGLTAKEHYVFLIESLSLEPFVGVLFDYEATGQKEAALSGYLCPMSQRAAGLLIP